jgi:hypothetical protein
MKFNEFLDHIHYLFIHSYACLTSPVNTPLCFNFWGISTLIVFFLLSIVFYKLLRKILKDRSDWNKYLLKVENRTKVADSETMAKSVWRGDL